jgi:hypothetical protein
MSECPSRGRVALVLAVGWAVGLAAVGVLFALSREAPPPAVSKTVAPPAVKQQFPPDDIDDEDLPPARITDPASVGEYMQKAALGGK